MAVGKASKVQRANRIAHADVVEHDQRRTNLIESQFPGHLEGVIETTFSLPPWREQSTRLLLLGGVDVLPEFMLCFSRFGGIDFGGWHRKMRRTSSSPLLSQIVGADFAKALPSGKMDRNQRRPEPATEIPSAEGQE